MDKVPNPARSAWLALRDELQNILGDDLVAMWAYGGTMSVDDPVRAGDLDTYVVISRRPDEATARAIEGAHDATASRLGVDWDVWYVLVDAALGTDPPHHAWRDERRDTSWAVNRAHWLAGRYANFHGPEPADLVKAPTWEELEADLDRELEHMSGMSWKAIPIPTRRRTRCSTAAASFTRLRPTMSPSRNAPQAPGLSSTFPTDGIPR